MTDQQIQEDQYSFPYHYIPRIENGVFYPSRDLFWGFRYISSLESIISEVDKIKFDSLLDLGCGDARFLNELSRHHESRKLTGIDTSKQALTFARAFNKDIEFIEADILAENFKSEKKYDVITLIEVIEHIDPNILDGFMSAARNLLTESGTLIVTVPSNNFPVLDKHFQHFSKESAAKVLEKNFNIIDIKFLNASGILVKIIQKVCSNRIYILNNKTLLKLIFGYYRKHYSLGNPKNCMQIMLVAKPK